jgi:hypothetical protein
MFKKMQNAKKTIFISMLASCTQNNMSIGTGLKQLPARRELHCSGSLHSE